MITTATVSRPGSSLLFVRSLLFYAGMIASMVLISLGVLLCLPLSFERRYRVAQYWSQFVIWWLKITCKIDCHVSGLEHIPAEAVVIASKHQSTWETIYFQQFLPPLTWVLKKELLVVPFFGWAMASLEPIAINRKAATAALKQVIRQGIERLKQGRWVLIFPEGTRVAPGEHGVYGSSSAMLAVNSGCPILPVAHNAGEFWPRRGFIKYPGTIELVFGPLIRSEGHKAKELNKRMEDWIESTMARIGQAPAKPEKVSG